MKPISPHSNKVSTAKLNSLCDQIVDLIKDDQSGYTEFDFQEILKSKLNPS